MTDPNPLREDEVEHPGNCYCVACMCAFERWLAARAAILRLDQVREGRGK